MGADAATRMQLGIICGCIAAIPLIVVKMRRNHYELHYICARPKCNARAALALHPRAKSGRA